MDWPNERYVRIYVRDTAEFLAMSWQARALLWEIIRKVDRSGVLTLGKRRAAALAGLVRWPVDVTDTALGELISEGRLAERGDAVVVPDHLAAQEARASDRMRQAESRARRREAKLATGDVTQRDSESRNVTDGHNTGQNVTRGHTESHAVTLSCAEPSRAESVLRMSDPAEPDTDSAPKRKRKSDPLPFPVLDALAAIHSTAGDDFPAVEARDLGGGVVIQIGRAIRAYPDVALWALVGRYVAAGGVTFPPPPLAPSWVASGRFREAMAAARAWDARGGGPIDRRGNGRAVPVSAHPGKNYDVKDAPW